MEGKKRLGEQTTFIAAGGWHSRSRRLHTGGVTVAPLVVALGLVCATPCPTLAMSTLALAWLGLACCHCHCHCHCRSQVQVRVHAPVEIVGDGASALAYDVAKEAMPCRPSRRTR
ncbi:hypothetical protein ACJQWK_02304 [Exserohilum turcicum]